MRVKVIVRGSPYSAVAIGAVGEVIERKYVGTKIEQWKVLFANGATWTFYSDEVEIIYGNEEEAQISAGAHR